MRLRFIATTILAIVCRSCIYADEWPAGYYGLPRPTFGCPTRAGFTWKTGWRYQDTEDKNPMNGRSASLHVDGFVRASSVNRSFCMKTFTYGDEKRPPWPSGQYCVYKRSEKCPTGLKSGYVKWHDEQVENQNSKKGYIPKGVYYWSTTKIYYCCRTDGNKARPISLPTGSPFYLLAYGSAVCQQVRWAEVTSEWIDYDTEDLSNKDSVWAPYPFGAAKASGEGHTIHYCYYHSCNYTLTERRGSFQSPRYPYNYPDGQHCSWRIMGNTGKIIQLRFTNFSLNGSADAVTVYDGGNETSNLIGSYNGTAIPRVVTSSAHALFVVFRSDQAASSAGFRAEYEIIGQSTTTVTSTELATTKTEAKPTTVDVTPQPTQGTEFKPTHATEQLATPTGHSNDSFELYKRACAGKSTSNDNTVLIVIPLACVIVVIAVAVYMLYRWRRLPGNKEKEAVVRYQPESVANPSYLRGDTIQNNIVTSHTTGRESTAENPYGSNEPTGDFYQEIQPSVQASENPIYQGTEPQKPVYQELKPPHGTGIHLYDSLA